MDVTLNIADVIASHAFLLTAVSVTSAVVGVLISVFLHNRSKNAEVECARIELMYKLMLNAVGMGDARRLVADGSGRLETFTHVQIMSLAALRRFPENIDVYEALEPHFRINAEKDPENRNFDITLHRELISLIEAIKKSNGRR